MIPASMPAAVYVGDGVLEVRDVRLEPPGPGEAVVAVSHCGICGSDLHLVLDKYLRSGSVPGHEWAGTVAAVGPDVDESWIGRRVVAGPVPGCGRCRPCRKGRPSVCLSRPAADAIGGRGAYATHVTVAASRLIELPVSLSTRDAALTEPTAIALHSITLAQVDATDRVLVTGAGPVGALTIAVLRAEGIVDITVTEPSPVRRARAQQLGATRVLSPDQLAQPPIGATADDPFDVAFECSGHASAAEAALANLAPAGTLVLVGTGSAPPRINQNRAIIKELTILGTYNYDDAGWQPAIDLLASGRIPLDLLAEPTDIGLAEILPTMHRLAAGEIPGKVMVRPGGTQ